MYVSEEHRYYRKARKKFSLKTYGLLCLWLILALIQWIVVAIIEDARHTFRSLYYICFVTFALAVLLFTLFIFIEKMRFMKGVNFAVSLIIVELQIISTFALVALSWWAEVLAFFLVALLLVVIFLIIGIFLPAKADLTLDIAILFIIAFIFLIIASFVLMFELLVWKTIPWAYLVVEISVTLTILLFVMYHGQTIHGNRFAEMRLNDFFLGSLILFHDFLIIYWLTFYWQTKYRHLTPDSWVATSTRDPEYNNNTRYRNIDSNLDWEQPHDRTTNLPWENENWSTKDDDGGDPNRGDKLYPQIPKGRGGNRDRGIYGNRDFGDDELYPQDPKGRDGNRGRGIYGKGNQGDDEPYPEIPNGRGGNRDRGIYGNRNHGERDPTDRRQPNNWVTTKDWSVYKRRPSHENRNGARTNSPTTTYDYLTTYYHDEWDPEYITQGLEKEVPFDDHFVDDSKDQPGEDILNPMPDEDYEEYMDHGDDEGKSAVGLENPSIDFPSADHQPSDDSEKREEPKTDDSPNIYIVPRTQSGNLRMEI
ncbi:uncharacterized protein LOC108096469 isoform X2 [Drosophila ficusphila]|uniref:uncharacterized protein LOC108096469 isoform X2 n=1 Tax=Drosophila ficusphila TaxID=30025 RepID=UPI0007E756E0|nr:uncharacterized protein LOC108096469 isoform X2 [Drosophila ficusphila]